MLTERRETRDLGRPSLVIDDPEHVHRVVVDIDVQSGQRAGRCGDEPCLDPCLERLVFEV
jgi:hypothetical protein